MKLSICVSFCATAQVFAFFVSAQDFSGDGIPDILWKRTMGGTDLLVWRMDPVYRTRIPPDIYMGHTGSDFGWRIVGCGDFGTSSSNPAPNGKLDILWRHETYDWTHVWFQDGGTSLGNLPVSYYPGNNWRIVGVGDFGSAPNGNLTKQRDGYSDIVWQNRVTYQKTLWIMEGTQRRAANNYLDFSVDWSVVAVADFGSSPANPNPDGNPDLVAVNYVSNQAAIWFMDGYEKKDTALIWNAQSGAYLTLAGDQDKRIVGAGDYFNDGNGRADLLVRHCTDGRNFVWRMDGKSFLAEWQITPHCYDVGWRIATQEYGSSNWRFNAGASAVASVGAVAVTGTDIDLRFMDFPSGTTGFTIQRAPAGSGQWGTVYSTSELTWTDNSVVPGNLYDYKVTGSTGTTVTTIAGTEIAPIHSRGQLLLVVESQLATQLGTSLTDFIKDVAGDGWQVSTKTDAPRHHDVWDSFNTQNVADIKSWVVSRYLAAPTAVKCVLLLGHVTIPYSGTQAWDGHPDDHAGPWGADLYYGDTSGPDWTSRPDGRFSNDVAPSVIELAVGRIDFAGLSSFLTGSTTEETLVRQYFAKNTRYRKKESSISSSGSGNLHHLFALSCSAREREAECGRLLG